MNFKDEDEAKRFLALWALIIMGILLIIVLLKPVAYAQKPNKEQEKHLRSYHKEHNRHVKKWKPCKNKNLHIPRPTRIGCV